MNIPNELPETQSAEPADSQTGKQFPAEDDFFHQLQLHETKAWDLVFSIYAPQLRRDIKQSLNKRALPLDWLDDIEQETWLAAVLRIHNFVWESEAKFYHYYELDKLMLEKIAHAIHCDIALHWIMLEGSSNSTDQSPSSDFASSTD